LEALSVTLEVFLVSQPCVLLGGHVGLVNVEEVSAGFAVDVGVIEEWKRLAALEALPLLHLAIFSDARRASSGFCFVRSELFVTGLADLLVRWGILGRYFGCPLSLG
jgi:hypothetical protein